MILRTIRVEGWRCFAAPFSIGTFTDGINIVHGPNGSGKSTIMMALVRGLFDNHHVGGSEIKALRPWNRKLAPKVTIEFEQGNERYQIFKQFLGTGSARLDRWEGGGYVPVADGRDADEQARNILSGEVPGRGTSDARHWGLAQIYWATQGGMQIQSLAAGTRDSIQDALGKQLSSHGSESIETAVATAYARFFTGTGKLKSGASAPAIVGLEQQSAKIKISISELVEKLDAFEVASRHIEDLQQQTESVRRREGTLRDQLVEVRKQADVYSKLSHQKLRNMSDAAVTEGDYKTLYTLITAVQDATRERDEAKRLCQRLLDDSQAVESMLSQSHANAAETDQSVKRLRGLRRDLRTKRELAQKAERYVNTLATLEKLNKQIQQITKAESELSGLREVRDAIVAPEKSTIQKITKLTKQRDEAKIKLDASVISVEIEAEKQIGVEVVRGLEPGDRQAKKGKPLTLRGAPDVVVSIPGVGLISASGPTGDFEELDRQRASAELKIGELSTGYEVDDLAGLERLRSSADSADERIARSTIKLETLLSGEGIAPLNERRMRLLNTLRAIEVDHLDWKTTRPVPNDLLRQADDNERRLESEIEAQEALHDRAQEAWAKEKQKHLHHQSEVARLKDRENAAEKQWVHLNADRRDDRQRIDELTRLAMVRDIAKEKLKNVEADIQELGDDPSRVVATLEGQLRAMGDSASDAAKKLNTESGRLEQIVADAPYSALAHNEEELDRLETEIGRQQVEIDAIRLLHETISHKKREALEMIVGPIQKRANHFMQRIAGARFDRIEFDESLLPKGITPKSSPDAVSLDMISGGENEQVHFAVRMALADITFDDQRQLVVLDDVFTYTDAARLARISTILDEATNRFQIVLFTCHPERYQGLPDASFFDIEDILRTD